jgi:aminoglycoside/choline kinase family phosphotransferase
MSGFLVFFLLLNMHISKVVAKEFKKWKNRDADRIETINSESASNRLYFRLHKADRSFIATYNSDIRENKAFFYLYNYFYKRHFPIPKLFYIADDEKLYFQQDLGNINLLQKLRKEGLSLEVVSLYRKSLTELARMQTSAHQLQFDKCYPRSYFDKQSIVWDLNYFKYYFLKVSGIVFDEQKLEDDFQFLANELSVKDTETTFMYRDFQARNIQIFESEPWFIDFQGGRKGPIAYDLVSLIYQASANLPVTFREQLKIHYFNEVNKYRDYSLDSFEKDFNNMVFIRILQTLGAYGFRGLIEGKEYFKNSIAPALHNLQDHLDSWTSKPKIPYFLEITYKLIEIKDKFEA